MESPLPTGRKAGLQVSDFQLTDRTLPRAGAARKIYRPPLRRLARESFKPGQKTKRPALTGALRYLEFVLKFQKFEPYGLRLFVLKS